jgi:hypothetical protein
MDGLTTVSGAATCFVLGFCCALNSSCGVHVAQGEKEAAQAASLYTHMHLLHACEGVSEL